MPAHARAPAPGSGSGPGLGLGSDSGSLPGLVLLELGLMGMGYAEHTRSAIRIRTDPLRYTDPNRPAKGCRGSWTANSCGGWVKPLQRFRPNRCNYQRLQWLGRTAATIRWVRTSWPLPERYK